MMRTLVLLLALFAAFGAKAQNATCPQPVVCDSNAWIESAKVVSDSCSHELIIT